MESEGKYTVNVGETAKRIDFIKWNFNEGDSLTFPDLVSVYAFKDFLAELQEECTPYLQPIRGKAQYTLATQLANR